MVTSSRKGCGTDTSLKMVKEFVLIERQEYNRDDVSKTTDASMRSIQQLLNAVKGRVGIMYHNKVENLFEFLKHTLQYCRGLILAKLLLMEYDYRVQTFTTC